LGVEYLENAERHESISLNEKQAGFYRFMDCVTVRERVPEYNQKEKYEQL
jgi:hypothetical protein